MGTAPLKASRAGCTSLSKIGGLKLYCLFLVSKIKGRMGIRVPAGSGLFGIMELGPLLI